MVVGIEELNLGLFQLTSAAQVRGPQFRRVGLFVDWNTQIREAPHDLLNQPVEQCRFALKRVGKLVTKQLCKMDDTSVFRVQVRLYHGWTAGVTQTVNRRAFQALSEFSDPDELFPSTRVLSLPDVQFGDRLIDALPERQNKRLQIHLPNTYRRQRGDEGPTEKMVDTALASDLLSWAKAEPSSIALVISNDDDIVPPIFVAEAWMKPYGGCIQLMRSAARGESRYLSLDGLLV